MFLSTSLQQPSRQEITGFKLIPAFRLSATHMATTTTKLDWKLLCRKEETDLSYHTREDTEEDPLEEEMKTYPQWGR